MTLESLRPLADVVAAPFVAGAKRVGLTPNAVSGLALVTAGVAAASFAVAGEKRFAYLVGSVLVGCNGLLDLVDGTLARELGAASPAGDLFDHVLDRYADIAIVAGLAAGIGEFAVGFAAITGVLMTSYLGTQAEAVGLDRVYGGLLGRADRLALVGIITAVVAFVDVTVRGLSPVGWLLVVFAAVGHLTALQRFYHARRELG